MQSIAARRSAASARRAVEGPAVTVFSRSARDTGQNLRRLYALRNVAVAGQAATVLTAVYGFGIALPVAPMAMIIAALAAFNVFTRWRLRRGSEIGTGEFFVQLLVDVGALTGLLYFSGGAFNPFVWLLLLPITIAATVLPPAHTRLLAVVTVLCYTALMVENMPLSRDTRLAAHGFELHVIGMWVGFVFSAGLLAYYVARMAGTLREREHLLAERREQALRDERLIALGTLAAGAAHELGTPLATMATVLREMERDRGEAATDPDTGRLRMLRGQVERCKQALAAIAASAGSVRAEAGRSLAVDEFIDEIVAGWRAMRHGATVRVALEGTCPAPHILAEHTLAQALITILNNAADASPREVELTAGWDADVLDIRVCDRGPGLAPAASRAAGHRRFTTKDEGLGLGLFLAHAAIGRCGGEVTLQARGDGGTCAHVRLPLRRLGTESDNDRT